MAIGGGSRSAVAIGERSRNAVAIGGGSRDAVAIGEESRSAVAIGGGSRDAVAIRGGSRGDAATGEIRKGAGGAPALYQRGGQESGYTKGKSHVKRGVRGMACK